MAVFFSKKQKAEFRKRKRRVEHKIKKEGDDEAQVAEKNGEEKGTATADVVVEPVKDDTVVLIPKKASSQEAKKVRKAARRQARADGKDPEKLEFFVEGKEPKKGASQSTSSSSGANKSSNNKKKRKREYPCLNDLVKEEAQAKQKKEEEAAHEQSEQVLTEDYKSRYLALDCEMVGIGTDGKKSVLARASLVDWDGKTVMDTFVQVPTRVSDFRTHVSGVTAADIRASKGAMKEGECRGKVAQLLKGKILVGHALKNDLHALLITHPKEDIRDTATYKPFQRLGGNKWRPRKLRDLVLEHVDMTIQAKGQAHDSTIDAQATMLLFRSARTEWEAELSEKASLWKKRRSS